MPHLQLLLPQRPFPPLLQGNPKEGDLDKQRKFAPYLQLLWLS
jgi:hypothetical protein